MTPFKQLTAVAVPLLRENVDTDVIIPSREIRTVAKTGLASGLFAGWRYLPGSARAPDPAFVLNNPVYAGAQILLAGENFGCGSSREHAVWALQEFGFRAIVAPSFNPIFFRNCVRNGMLPARLVSAEVRRMATRVEENPQQHRVTLDLETCEIKIGAECWHFQIEAAARADLLEGLDAVDRTLQLLDAILAARESDRQSRPWVYELGGQGGQSEK
jgi:3-isopropylmalate/(R)-2-methylmalate dehydratase small subunit